jgi:tetratricopeptide (TPR) repeat protein
MAEIRRNPRSTPKEIVMRYFPAAAALSLVVAVSASVGHGAERQPDAQAVALVEQGRAALQAGDTQTAVDSFEAALAVDPGYTQVYLHLAEAARANGLQGKAIHYYREALEREPSNFAAISGEGEALLEKGAVEKARRNLAQLQSLCGAGCSETQQLAAAIDRGPTMIASEAITAASKVVTQN